MEKLGYKHIQTDQPLESTHARHPSHLNDQRKQCCVFQLLISHEKSPSISRDKKHPGLTGSLEGKTRGRENRKRVRINNLLHIHCVQQEQIERELSVLEEVGCKPVLNGYYVLSKSIVSWSPGLTMSHCGKCKDKLVKSQFSLHFQSPGLYP